MSLGRAVLPMMTGMLVGVLASGCEDKPKPDLAPTASALAPAKPTSVKAARLTVEASTADVSFEMDAPLEKIIGKAPGSMTGELFMDLSDVTQSSGLVKVDLDKLKISQQERKKEGAELSEEKTLDTQNQHARAWLEIGEDTPKDKREEFRQIEFKITKIEAKGGKSFSAMDGEDRKLVIIVTGDFRLHGRKTSKSAEVEVSVKFDGDNPVSAHFKTVKPFKVGLDEHDVRPRDGFGKLAAKTLDAVSPKVAKEAEVSLNFTAKAEATRAVP